MNQKALKTLEYNKILELLEAMPPPLLKGLVPKPEAS